ncbi:hypothetical protein JTB14_024459 [Gonioctena quinquepunctata]|nr:hypothetical protein JTB14_024459 [Gonioctena quinquepunctata]
MLRLSHVIVLLLLVIRLQGKVVEEEAFLVASAERGDSIDTDCNVHDLGCTGSMFIIKNRGTPMIYSVNNAIEFTFNIKGEEEYSCGCFLQEQNSKNVTYRVVFESGTANVYKKERWGKFKVTKRTSSAFVLDSPTFSVWTWVILIHEIGRWRN